MLAVLSAGAAEAQSVDRAPKWGAHIDMEGKLGTDRNLGEADLFIPLTQTDTSLLFTSLRSRLDDNDSIEGNFGLGLRHMLPSGWNIGGYGYFDRRHTEWDNNFNQVTLGLEALSLDWDARGNVYLPVGRRSHQVDQLSDATVSGTGVTFRGGEERSMGGFDAEIGWRVPVYAADDTRQLRVYGGGYHFTEDGVPDISGPRLRAEMVFDTVPGLWDGSRFSIGAEWQHDDPRGGQGFLTARLRIPLQAASRNTARLTPMERRMTDPVVRDIDIVSQGGAFGAAEAVTRTADGKTITVLSSASTTGANLPGAVTAAGANSVVVLNGSFSTTASVTLQAGQTLSGGAGLQVRSASGRVATISSPRATISASTGASAAAVEAATNSTVTGLDIRHVNNAATGTNVVRANGVTGVTISNNVIYSSEQGNNSTNGILITNGSSATITGNTITAVGNSNFSNSVIAINVFGAGNTVTIANNTLSASGSSNASLNRFLALGNGSTVTTAASTGNTALAGICSNLGATGFASFTNGTTCP